jgi:hypothetical protein
MLLQSILMNSHQSEPTESDRSLQIHLLHPVKNVLLLPAVTVYFIRMHTLLRTPTRPDDAPETLHLLIAWLYMHRREHQADRKASLELALTKDARISGNGLLCSHARHRERPLPLNIVKPHVLVSSRSFLGLGSGGIAWLSGAMAAWCEAAKY